MYYIPPALIEVLEETGYLATWKAKAEARGEAKGLEKGIEEGMEKGREAVARNALAQGFSPETVHDITGLDLEIIKGLQSSLR